MKNLLLKKSFLKLSLFVLAFSSIFSNCGPGGSVDAAVYIFYKENGVEKIAHTFFFTANQKKDYIYDAPVGRKITKVKLTTDIAAKNMSFNILWSTPNNNDSCTLLNNNEECVPKIPASSVGIVTIVSQPPLD